MDLNKYREYFPVTKAKIYLNHAAISPLSLRVSNAIQDSIKERQSGSIDTFVQFMETRAALKQNLARLVNGEAEQIAIITNTSEGLNWLVNGLQWKPGDHVVLTDYEFPSNVYPFLNLKRHGVETDFVSNRDGRILVDDIEALITAKTRIVSISFVEFLNGFKNDLEAIGSLCREKGVIFSVDSIQGLGAAPIDVKKFNIDFLSNGGHKWLLGPCGAGFMYIAPDLHNRLQPASAGWLSVKNSWDFFDYNLDWLDSAERYEIGTPNALGIAGLKASTDLLLEAGVENIYRHLLRLGNLLTEKMQELGFKYLGSDQENEKAGIYSFSLPDATVAEKLFEFLKQNRVEISLRNSALRFAPHFYNTMQEIEASVQLCEKFLI